MPDARNPLEDSNATPEKDCCARYSRTYHSAGCSAVQHFPRLRRPMCLPAAVCSGLTNLRSADLRLLSDDEPHALCCSTEPAGLHLANVPSSALDLWIHLQCEIRIVWA